MRPHELDIESVRQIAAVPRILDVVCQTTGLGFAAVARVTEDKWVACEVLDTCGFGLAAGGELAIATTLCNEVRERREAIVVDNFAEDSVYVNHHTPRTYGLQSYISVPILLPDGAFFGTLCALDAKPAELKNDRTLGMFRLFAELIAFHLDANQKLQSTRAELASHRAIAELREQFIAVLGHDLRNPLASVVAGVSMLAREPQTSRSAEVLTLVKKTVGRMSSLIDNLLDFARGRMGDGLTVELEGARLLTPTLEQVVSELRSSNVRDIRADVRVDRPVIVDHARMAQLFSNLLGNAVAHGDPLKPIHARAEIVDGMLEIAVSNGGLPIPSDVMEDLFLPFKRGKSGTHRQGLGLGLYIASQIAHAHGGTLDVQSDPQETRFTFKMPVA